MSSSSDEDDFMRIHAKAIAEALHQRDASEQSQSGSTKSDRERLIHETYVALCYDDPRVESDLGCQYLATALLDPHSPFALSGPLVEGIQKLCAKHVQQTAPVPDRDGDSLMASNSSTSPHGSALLAWAIRARIPLLCCQASDLSQVHAYLGSYRPPPPPNPVDNVDGGLALNPQQQQQLGKDADRLAAMLSQMPNEESNAKIDNDNSQIGQEEEHEVWAAESDPSDFEFESGFSYEQQLADVENSYAAWMIDRTDPLKLSKPPAATTTWKQVRHAVMDLMSQLNYRELASLFGSQNPTILSGNQGPSTILTQLTMALLVPPSGHANQSSLFDSPDDDDALQSQRQLQAMAWYPLWVLRDAATSANNHSTSFSAYLSMLQTLIAVDAAQPQQLTVAPATYVGLASLSALCQQVTTDAELSSSGNIVVERYRELRRSVWETFDDLAHIMEQEDKIRKATKDKDASLGDAKNHWSDWTFLPLFEILTNQRLQTGATIVAKAESLAQKHHNQHQQWSAGLLQSGLFRHWLLRCQALRLGEQMESVTLLWQLVRRSLLYVIAQSMPATSALGKYAWRFPNFAITVEIGESFRREADDNVPAATDVDDILWNMLAMELAGSLEAPTIQWKSIAKNKPSISATQPLPSRLECQKVCWHGFQGLCKGVVRVLELACQEENKKENTDANNATEKQGKQEDTKLRHQLLLKDFQRFVNTLAACPLLAKIFANNLEPDAGEGSDGTIAKCLDDVQSALSQYKAPFPNSATGPPSQKAKDEDGQGLEVESTRAAKDQVQDAVLLEDIHMVRRELKVLRSMFASKASEDLASAVSLDLKSCSKTD